MSTSGDDATVLPPEVDPSTDDLSANEASAAAASVDDVSDDELAAQLEPPVEPLSPEEQERTVEEVMGLLAEHVPLALLADLASPDGPVSQAILEEEGLPDDAWWDAEDDPRPEDPEGTSPAT